MENETGKPHNWTKAHRSNLRKEYGQLVGSMDKQTRENLEVASRQHTKKRKDADKSRAQE